MRYIHKITLVAFLIFGSYSSFLFAQISPQNEELIRNVMETTQWCNELPACFLTVNEDGMAEMLGAQGVRIFGEHHFEYLELFNEASSEFIAGFAQGGMSIHDDGRVSDSAYSRILMGEPGYGRAFLTGDDISHEEAMQRARMRRNKNWKDIQNALNSVRPFDFPFCAFSAYGTVGGQRVQGERYVERIVQHLLEDEVYDQQDTILDFDDEEIPVKQIRLVIETTILNDNSISRMGYELSFMNKPDWPPYVVRMRQFSLGDEEEFSFGGKDRDPKLDTSTIWKKIELGETALVLPDQVEVSKIGGEFVERRTARFKWQELDASTTEVFDYPTFRKRILESIENIEKKLRR